MKTDQSLEVIEVFICMKSSICECHLLALSHALCNFVSFVALAAINPRHMTYFSPYFLTHTDYMCAVIVILVYV